MNTFQETLKAAIAKARDDQGMSVSELARRTGLHHVTLRKVLAGNDKAMGWEAVEKVAAALKLSKEARQDLLWAWLETKAGRNDETMAFLRALRIVSKDMKGDGEPRIRQLVIKLYEDRLKDEKPPEQE